MCDITGFDQYNLYYFKKTLNQKHRKIHRNVYNTLEYNRLRMAVIMIDTHGNFSVIYKNVDSG
jgi:hypothetical protein